MATPLHSHSHYSALDGLAKPQEMADRVKELGFGSCGLTDHDVVAGHYEFYNTMIKEGIKPILGIETYQTLGSRQTNLGFRTDPKTKERADNFHLILLAMNNEGLRNLWRLNSESHKTGFYYNGRADWDLLERYNEGIIATSACGLGALSQAVRDNSRAGDAETLLNRYLDIFGDRFYIELSTYGEVWQHYLNQSLESLAESRGIPLVYANDAHYAFPGQYKLHEIVLCMQYQEKLSKREEPHHIPDLYIMAEDEVESALNHLSWTTASEAIENSDIIANRCNVTFPDRKVRIPVYIPESNWANAREMLFDLAHAGYQKKIIDRGLDSDVYMDRFKQEIKVIFDANLVDYFLIVRDFISHATENGMLVGPGRGSVGGSLIAYLLDITKIDPIRYGLIFERFYNVGREGSLPDIDTDFPTFGRDFIRQYLIKKYGEDFVVDIGTVTSYQGRNAIQKLGSTLEISYGDTKKISEIIEGAIESGLQPDWESLNKVAALKPWETKYPELFNYARTIFGNTFNYGIHASGIVISDEELSGIFPLRWHSKEQKPVTQFDMRIADKLGLMKVDVLGLRNLDVLMELNKILIQQGKESIDFATLHEQEHPAEMFELLENGLTVGMFQIEEGKDAKRLCRQIKPRSVEELALITAINRPGPLIAGSDKRYMKGRAGEEVEYLHPLVEKVAKESYGEFIYQEQVINLFTELGYSLTEADNMRAIIGKKLREQMQKEKPRYMELALKQMDQETADTIWENIENFSKYAFNKSHSIAYGIILLWTLYAKYYHPREFYLASIRVMVEHGKKDKLPSYIKEAPRLGVQIFRPELNISKAEASIKDDGIRYGYADIKGVGMAAAKWLEKHQPFKDFDDLLSVSQKDENKITLRNGLRKVAIHKGQIESIRRLMESKDDDLIAAEEELLGVALSDDSHLILSQYPEFVKNSDTIDEVLEGKKSSYQVAGIITNVRETKTKTGSPMAWVTIENEGQTLDMTVWQEGIDRFRFALANRTAGIFSVTANDRGVNLKNVKILFRQDNG